MISELTDCSPPANPSRSRQPMASTTHRVIRKNPNASGDVIQPATSLESPGNIGPA